MELKKFTVSLLSLPGSIFIDTLATIHYMATHILWVDALELTFLIIFDQIVAMVIHTCINIIIISKRINLLHIISWQIIG
jgi:hypothetical protein